MAPGLNLACPSTAEHPQVPTYDPEVPQVSIEKMVELSQAMVDGVLADHRDVLCDAGVSQSVVKVRILNSNGAGRLIREDGFLPGFGRYLWCGALTCSSSEMERVHVGQ